MNTDTDFKVAPLTDADLAYLLRLLMAEPASSERAA